MRHPLDTHLAAPLEDVEDLRGTAVKMAEGGVGNERQAVCHHVQGSEVTIDQPLQRAALQGKAADVALMAQARPLLYGHSGAPMIATPQTFTISTKGWSTARSGAPGCGSRWSGSVVGVVAASDPFLSCSGRGWVRPTTSPWWSE